VDRHHALRWALCIANRIRENETGSALEVLTDNAGLLTFGHSIYGRQVCMKRERKEIRGVLTLGTLLRLSAVAGFVIGLMGGVFYGGVRFQLNGNLLELILTVLIAPFFNASLVGLITMIAYPMYVVLGRAGLLGVDKVTYEVTMD